MESSIEKNMRHLLQLRYGIIGESPAMQAAMNMLVQAAPTDLSVLITGETGTGKEVFANALHGLSNRRKAPFVSVNCGAIPETLLESELFGHERGAFTSAVEQRKGFFESANKGTLFLDEIGEMPIGTQVKLLRVLENGEYSRLGSSLVHRVDVRIIAATNRDLEKNVNEGKFRRDLFFRLNSVHIILPELRTHVQDIPELVEYFAEKTGEKIGVNFSGISLDSLNILKSLPWPGNVRELRNLTDTIVTLEKGAYISPEILMKYIPASLPEYKFEQSDKDNSLLVLPSIKEEIIGDNALILRTLLDIKNDISDIKRGLRGMAVAIDDIKVSPRYSESHIDMSDYVKVDEKENFNLSEAENELIAKALKKYAGNRRQAANALGISERTLYRKLVELGIEV